MPVVLVRVTVVLFASKVVVNPTILLGVWIPSGNCENLNGWELCEALLNLYVLPAKNVKDGWYTDPDPVSMKNLFPLSRESIGAVVAGTPTFAIESWSVKLPPEAQIIRVIFPPELMTS